MQGDSDRLEHRLTELWERGRRAHPDLKVDAGTFAEHLGRCGARVGNILRDVHAEEGPQAARVQVRREHDRLRVHAGSRDGRRPRGLVSIRQSRSWERRPRHRTPLRQNAAHNRRTKADVRSSLP
jgi:hypothetical protein